MGRGKTPAGHEGKGCVKERGRKEDIGGDWKGGEGERFGDETPVTSEGKA